MILKIVNKNIKNTFLSENGTDTDVFWDELKKKQSIDPLEWLIDLDARNIQLQFSTIDDVLDNPDDIFYFVYYSSNLFFHNIIKHDNNNNFLEIIKLFKQKNIRILFLDPHECIDEIEIKHLSNFLKSHNINAKNFLYVNNDFYIKDTSKKYGISAKKWNHLFINTSSGYITDSKNITFKKEREFVFLSKNKMMKPHRMLLISFLQKNKLLDITNYSCLHFFFDYLEMCENIENIFNTNIMNEYKKQIQFFMNFGIFETKYEKGNYTLEGEENINYAGHFTLDDYHSSYINITSESGYDESFLHISEKSLKPFAMYQLPIFVSSPFHVKSMKELYDLDFFDDFIDHSYDNEIDNVKRIKLIFKEILRLSELKNELPNFFEKNKSRFISNREKIKKIGNWKETNILNDILNM